MTGIRWSFFVPVEADPPSTHLDQAPPSPLDRKQIFSLHLETEHSAEKFNINKLHDNVLQPYFDPTRKYEEEKNCDMTIVVDVAQVYAMRPLL